ncbi:MAG: divalent metal cation transporter [Chloroflexi bacterium]|nr:MAG: divalent metal cation transporter [Chloroflexota bacterium]TMG60144.1 MAG: divalent metal cation transporter [Chloroflexota bacterium]
MGPGIITGFAGNDAGGVTTYTAVGARYGFEMMWLLLLSTAGLLVIQEMCARMGAVTGKGLSDLIRERFGVRWTIVAMLALLIANGSNIVAEYAGIAASLELFHVQRIVSVPITAVLIWVLVVFFSYRIVERALFVLVLAYIAYPISALIVGPPWGEVVRDSVIPSLPIGQAALIAALALVGTTITPYMQFYIQASVVDKGIDRDQYRFERVDVLLGAILTGLNGFFIVVVAGAVLHPAGIHVDSAADAAQALGPLAGQQAQLLFGVGLFGASLLAATIMPLSTSYAICEAFGWESGISKNFREAPVFMGLFTLLVVAGALIVLSPSVPLIPVILVSQNVNGLLLPIVLVFILKLAGDRRIMGDHANGRVSQWIGIGTAIGASVLSIALVAITILGAG